MKKYKYTGIYSDHKKVLDKLSDAQAAEKDLREQAREAHLFVDKRDGQWEPERLNANANGDKPRYTFDMCNPIVDQVVSEIEQADFDIQVNPAGGDGTTAIAATYDGIIRNIEVMRGYIRNDRSSRQAERGSPRPPRVKRDVG